MSEDRVEAVQQIVAQHLEYWENEGRVSELRRLHRAYMHRFWAGQGILQSGGIDEIVVETADAHVWIEQYCANLFAADPSVTLQPGPEAKGDAPKAEAVANHWLRKQKTTLERASRLALIFPLSAIKLYPCDEGEDAKTTIRMQAIRPWDLVVDDAVDDVREARYLGHRYWVLEDEAVEKHGGTTGPGGDWEGCDRATTLDDDPHRDRESAKWVQIYEIYQGQGAQRLWYSEHYRGGEEIIEVEDNPFTQHDGSPRIPIIPWVYGEDPDCPLRGYSTLARFYDQLAEQNLIRTFLARSVRKLGRVWLTKRGLLTPEHHGAIKSGEDGLILEVDENTPDLKAAMVALSHEPVSPEIQAYARQVQQDLERGPVMASFARGAPARPGATATEVTAQAAYTASEIGYLASIRDEVIRQVAACYLDMQALYLEDPSILVVQGESQVLSPHDLVGGFEVYPSDAGNTPLSRQAKKTEYLSLLPQLAQLGVAPDILLREMVRLFELPETMLPKAPTPEPEGEGEEKLPRTTNEMIEQIAAQQPTAEHPSPARIGEILPGGSQF